MADVIAFSKDARKTEFHNWNMLKPVYFPTWVWAEICERYPDKYKMAMPVYQGQKVVLT